MAVARHALTLRSRGQRSRSCGYLMRSDDRPTLVDGPRESESSGADVEVWAEDDGDGWRWRGDWVRSTTAAVLADEWRTGRRVTTVVQSDAVVVALSTALDRQLDERHRHRLHITPSHLTSPHLHSWAGWHTVQSSGITRRQLLYQYSLGIAEIPRNQFPCNILVTSSRGCR